MWLTLYLSRSRCWAKQSLSPQVSTCFTKSKSTDLPTQMKSRKKNSEKVPMKKRYAMCSIQVWSESWLLLEKTQHLRI